MHISYIYIYKYIYIKLSNSKGDSLHQVDRLRRPSQSFQHLTVAESSSIVQQVKANLDAEAHEVTKRCTC